MMRNKRSGRIINISSIVGLQGCEGQAVYSASKAAVIGLHDLLQRIGRYGITVNAIAPGL
jgi:3-oxoacyl-[acyl-carrier protein] reductase